MKKKLPKILNLLLLFLVQGCVVNSIPLVPIEEAISNNCLSPTVIEGLSENYGTLVTFNYKNISLLNAHANMKIGETQILSGIFVKGQKIAFIDSEKQELIIASSNGEILLSIPASKNWLEILGWTDKFLIISNMPFKEGGGWYPPSSTLFLNIDTRKYFEMLPEFPDIYFYSSGSPNFGRYSYSLAAYDPSVTRVVYPGITATSMFVSLWDISSSNEVVRLQLSYPYSPPQWRHDGQFFVITLPNQIVDSQFSHSVGDELFKIDRDGQITRLTYLTTKGIARQNSYAWSPDGKLIAFWLKFDNDEKGWQLAILDTESLRVTNYCIGGGDGSYPIIWSPDNNKIISTIKNSDNDELEFILVDIKEQVAFRILKEGIVVGWVN